MAELNGDGVLEVQAAAEGITLTGRVEFLGGSYRLGEKIGLMPLLKFAHASSSGLGADDMEGMAAMYAMIRDCIAEADWARFEKAAIDGHADGDDLMKVVQQAMEQIAARPTPPPSGSSPPAPDQSGNSRAPSSLPAAFRDLPPGDLIDVDSVLRSTR